MIGRPMNWRENSWCGSKGFLGGCWLDVRLFMIPKRMFYQHGTVAVEGWILSCWTENNGNYGKVWRKWGLNNAVIGGFIRSSFEQFVTLIVIYGKVFNWIIWSFFFASIFFHQTHCWGWFINQVGSLPRSSLLLIERFQLRGFKANVFFLLYFHSIFYH